MKKATKLLLSILPISSIGFLSVVSCSTKNANNKSPEHKIDDQSNRDSENPIDSNNKNPNSPTNKPNGMPKKPEQPSDSSDRDTNKPNPSDQPQKDENTDANNDFSDLEKMEEEISFSTISIYAKKDALSALVTLKTDNSVFNIIFPNNITDKYNVVPIFENGWKEDKQKGLIDNAIIKFTNKKNNKSKSRKFIFTGFKKVESNGNKVNNKDIYLKPKSQIDSKISGLFPSLLAYMLLYTEDSNKYKGLQNDSTKSITFEQLINKNTDLFDNKFVGFSVGTKDLLFDFEEKYRELYGYKIIETSFDDINGTLGVKVQITNSEENKGSEPEKTKEFIFKGFRKVDIDKNRDIPLLFSLTPRDLKTILKDEKIIKHLKEKVGVDIYKDSGHTDLGVQSKDNLWESLILKYLTIMLVDNEHHIYNSKETLSLKNTKENNHRSILGLKPKMSLYPFNTSIDESSISEILITLVDKKVTLDFEINIPVYATGFSDLTSHSSNNSKILKIRVSSTISVAELSKK
ncbi:LppA family lipoprotein [Mycoplasma feriruminatoris]|uniref:LppA family lipoprotein n=1 Tax=Mycoplasma feriruminatoris TaxID=1179777 RepID=UPI0024201C7A|nr:LppA family lipoprotein [Mycoplasma feriruminatoris]WFQ90612.1 LppA family lipoprotein [Mycoplasma feriruminatoris]